MGALGAALGGLRGRVGRVYVHLDLDVLDPAGVGKANEFAPEGGRLTPRSSLHASTFKQRQEYAIWGIHSLSHSLYAFTS